MEGVGDDGMMGMGHEKKMMPVHMHMTFFWGKHAEVLFSGWPGTRTGMYVLALIVVFLMAVLLEWISHSGLTKVGLGLGSSSAPRFLVGLGQALLHAIRMGVSYLIMLALMSFNGGVFVAAIAGHLVGFLGFGSRVFKRTEMPPYVKQNDNAAPMSC